MAKLNVGCGKEAQLGYINVDLIAYPGVDLVADARCLPFKDYSIESVLFSHMLEHLYLDVAIEALEEAHRVLKITGNVELYVPDMGLLASKWNDMSMQDKMNATPAILGVGPRRGENQCHMSLWDKNIASMCLGRAGFAGATFRVLYNYYKLMYWLHVTAWKDRRAYEEDSAVS